MVFGLRCLFAASSVCSEGFLVYLMTSQSLNSRSSYLQSSQPVPTGHASAAAPLQSINFKELMFDNFRER
jgi:hypothetical protein